MSNEVTMPDEQVLRDAHCWFDVDRVPGRPDVTAFKRAARLHQAQWREAQGLAVGSHRSGDPPKDRPNGSRLTEVDAAADRNFLDPSIVDAVEARVHAPQPHQTLSVDRLRGDLLSSMPMCFNLFGAVHDDLDAASAAATTIWPDLDVDRSTAVRFEWSPGRNDPAYTGDRTAFDAAFEVTRADGSVGVIAVETKYHEHATTGGKPDETSRMPRYRAIVERSGVFTSDWERLLGTDLQQIWRDHLLVLSMLGAGWDFGRYVLVYPAANPSFRDVADRYREVLVDDATFEARTIEELLDTGTLHPPELGSAFRERYVIS